MKKDLLRLILITSLILISVIGAIAQDSSCAIIAEKETTSDFLKIALPIQNICNTSKSSSATLSEDNFFYNGSIEANQNLCLQFDKFGIRIPEGSKILGLAIRLVGYQDSNKPISIKKVQFYKNRGSFIGVNKANKIVTGSELNSINEHWQYGFSADNWGFDLSDTLVNSNKFGFEIELVNNSNSLSNFHLDIVDLKVYYEELFTVCNGKSTFLYVEPQENVEYEWEYSTDLKSKSEDGLSNTINLDMSAASIGMHTICVNSFIDGQVIDTCCRKILVKDCGLSTLKGNVWKDFNSDGIKENDEDGYEGMTIKLVENNSGLFTKAETDANGRFEFKSLNEGYYFLEMDAKGNSASPYQVGNPLFDNDALLMNDKIRTKAFYIKSNTDFSGIDIGIVSSRTISGTLYNDVYGNLESKTSIQLRDVTIELFNESGNLVAEVITSSDGRYKFENLPIGKYTIQPILPSKFGFSQYFSKNNLNVDIKTSSYISNLDIFLISYSEIGDFVWEDLNRNGIQDINEKGIADVTIQLFDKDGEWIKGDISEQNGFYLFDSIFPGSYRIVFDKKLNYEYTTISNIENLNSNVINNDGQTDLVNIKSGTKNRTIDAGYTRKFNSIGGYVWEETNFNLLQDPFENGVEGVVIKLLNEDKNELDSTLTDENGEYEFNNLGNGGYYIATEKTISNTIIERTQADLDKNSDLNANYISDQFFIDGVNAPAPIDIGLIICSNVIGDFVWMDSNNNGLQDSEEKGIGGITVSLYKGTQKIFTDTTDENGHYLFKDIAEGEYHVEFVYPHNFSKTKNIGIESQNSDIIVEAQEGNFTIGKSGNFNFENCAANLDIDGGLKPIVEFIGDYVWDDSNKNGKQDDNENGLNGVSVKLFDGNGFFIDSTQTNYNPITGKLGYYYFKGAFKGKYYLQFILLDQFLYTIPNIGNSNKNSDVTGSNGEGTTDLFEFNPGQMNDYYDAGFYSIYTEIGDYVWKDQNSNGIQDENEVGANGVIVNLYDEKNTLISTTKTKSNPQNGSLGYYQFKGNYSGKYYLQFEVSKEMKFAPAKKGNDILDSDVTGANGYGTTDFIEIYPGQNNLNIDAGFFEPQTSIGDFVWIDFNSNGLQDPDEPGLSGVEIVLYETNGKLVDRTISNADGYYKINNVSPGNYYLTFSKKTAFEYTKIVLPFQDKNSDVNENGRTKIFSLYSGEVKNDIDAGYISTTYVGNLIWNDFNKDGIQNGEKGIEGVSVSIFSLDNKLLSSTISDSKGKYGFYGIESGRYYLQFEIPQGFQVAISNASNDEIDNDGMNSGKTEVFYLGANQKIDWIDIGMYDNEDPSSGTLHHDLNLDHQYNSFEKGIEGVRLSLISIVGEIVYDVQTNKYGKFELGILPKGQYSLQVELPQSYYVSNLDLSQIKFDNSGKSQVINAQGIAIKNLDLGLYTYGTIEMNVWKDNNGNGIKEENDGALKDYKASLYSIEGDFLGNFAGVQQTTIKVLPGMYFIKMEKDTGMFLTDYKAAGSTDFTDSDFMETEINYESFPFSIYSKELKQTISVGLYEPGTLGKMVWLDEDYNGMQGENEVGIVGAQIDIYNEQKELIATETSDAQGHYKVENLRKGNYYLKFRLDGPYEFTMNVNSDENHNSDVDNSFGYGTTKLFSINPSEFIDNVDAGVVINDLIFSNLLAFTGRREGEENVIEWATQVDKIISKYELERRKDGAHKFEKIAEISAIDQEKYLQEYRFLDINSGDEGNYYYRLKEFDLEGNYSYSHVIVVKAFHQTFTFEIYPNPTKENLHLQFEVAEQSKVEIRLLDEAGRKIKNLIEYQDFKTGVYEKTFDISTIPKGFYILQMDAGYRTYHEKIIIDQD